MSARSGSSTAGVAGRAFVVTLVALTTVVSALAIWKLKILVALLFLGIILAAAMRPGVEALARRRIPRPVGVLIHYAGVVVVLGIVLWFVVPTSLHQVQEAVGNVPTSRGELKTAVHNSTGVKHEILVAIQRRLQRAPSATAFLHPALDLTRRGLEILAGIFFVFAVGAYWIFERERAVDFVASVLPRPKRKKMRDTWELIDLKLGAFVRGQLLLILLVGTVLSLAFMTIGEPYWILVGAFAGVVEIVPVIGPLAAGALAIGVGFTASWHTALAAGLCVLGVRLAEDYLIVPRVLGDAVGLSPLLVLVSVTAVGILFGGFAVILAVPIAAVLVTLLDVIVLDKDPAKEDAPTVLFPAKDLES